MTTQEFIASRWPSLTAAGVVTVRPDPQKTTVTKSRSYRKPLKMDAESVAQRERVRKYRERNRKYHTDKTTKWRLKNRDYALAYQRAISHARRHDLPFEWDRTTRTNKAI